MTNVPSHPGKLAVAVSGDPAATRKRKAVEQIVNRQARSAVTVRSVPLLLTTMTRTATPTSPARTLNDVSRPAHGRSSHGQWPREAIGAGQSHAVGKEARDVSPAPREMESAMRIRTKLAAFRRGRRRRRGEMFTLWIKMWRGIRCGYLVTEGEDYPNPVAYVPIPARSTPLRKALAARKTPHRISRIKDAIDVRMLTPHERADLLANGLLLPVDSLGRVISKDRTLAAGVYIYATRHGAMCSGFLRYPREAVATLPFVASVLGESDSKKESGASVNSAAPELGGEGSNTRAHATAA